VIVTNTKKHLGMINRINMIVTNTKSINLSVLVLTLSGFIQYIPSKIFLKSLTWSYHEYVA